MVNFNPNEPIYLQLMNRIIGEIVRGQRKAGEKLPSVREYAVDVGVNVNTIQRVYRELEYEAIVETKRGQGTFVTSNSERLETLRDDKKREIVHHFMKNMQEMGYNKEEMVMSIKLQGDEE
ncbi:GntR family transcriptional regulator [Ornithinibacillus halophilus]|uniref:Transcriptional regulator, GntR family n=1 Tax=Ornithinibacillus halophilus TaxID=930117 RepID=A0A1M5NBI3_9BACI|nr:GntR family transcriptional regulator [Ornithinibacillus halophilus]SHG86890.1 transcriptional regulator, GntR family [Ornithinibacillus halophilus]